MRRIDLAPDLKAFITKYIKSVAMLDVLFLFSENPEMAWSITEISSELRTNFRSATDNVSHFLSAGLIVKTSDDRFIYAPNSEEVRDIIQKLSNEFKEKPVTIITYIYQRSDESLQALSDAFKVKK